MVNDENYLRISTSYYKRIFKPLISGDTLEILAPWSKDCIKDDHNRDFISKIKKYDGFCCVPDHLNFKSTVSNFYNTYKPLNYNPKKGTITNSLKFIDHIFCEQAELGLDYLKILYMLPTQILPVLCLLSNERNTGKTTFLNWLKSIFGSNLTYNTNDDFRSQFNSDWSSKLIIAVDEVLLDKKEDVERIKNLSTARTYKVEAKGKDKNEIEFFGKFILCSNNENNFIQIQPGEIRFWARKIRPFAIEDKNFLEKLIVEIPAFLEFLIIREYSTPNKTRMWFTPQQLQTDALRKLINFNRNRIEIELVSEIVDIIENFDLDEFQFCLNDLQNLLSRTNYRITKGKIKAIVKDTWELRPVENSLAYKKFTLLSDGTVVECSGKGRFYTIKKSYLMKNYDDLMN